MIQRKNWEAVVIKFFGIVLVMFGTILAAHADTAFTNFSFPSQLPNASTAPSAQTDPARWGQIVNVKDFGAKGDGSTDDTNAIQAAINWANTTAARGVIYFPPNVRASDGKVTCYMVNAPIIIPESKAGLVDQSVAASTRNQS
jgi:hypothetical protein